MSSIINNCLPHQFLCSDGRCIFERYRCDQRRDCRDGSDETVELCGDDPCQGRIECENDGRCIPISWCCHRPASIPDDHPYECDFWQLKLCCYRSEIKFDPSQWWKQPETTHAPTTSRISTPTSPILIASVCSLVSVAVILFFCIIGVWYFKKSSQRQRQQQQQRNDEENRQSDIRDRIAQELLRIRERDDRIRDERRRRQENDEENEHLQRDQLAQIFERRRGRSQSAPSHRCRSSIDPRRPSADNADLYVLFSNDGRLRFSHHSIGNSRCRRCEPTCTILLQFPNDDDPPSYTDLEHSAINPTPDSNIDNDDGLPNYDAALNLIQNQPINN